MTVTKKNTKKGGGRSKKIMKGGADGAGATLVYDKAPPADAESPAPVPEGEDPQSQLYARPQKIPPVVDPHAPALPDRVGKPKIGEQPGEDTSVETERQLSMKESGELVPEDYQPVRPEGAHPYPPPGTPGGEDAVPPPLPKPRTDPRILEAQGLFEIGNQDFLKEIKLETFGEGFHEIQGNAPIKFVRFGKHKNKMVGVVLPGDMNVIFFE